MLCSKCGKENPEGYSFCSGCGAPLNSLPVQPAAPQAPVQPVPQNITENQAFAPPAAVPVQPTPAPQVSAVPPVAPPVPQAAPPQAAQFAPPAALPVQGEYAQPQANQAPAGVYATPVAAAVAAKPKVNLLEKLFSIFGASSVKELIKKPAVIGIAAGIVVVLIAAIVLSINASLPGGSTPRAVTRKLESAIKAKSSSKLLKCFDSTDVKVAERQYNLYKSKGDKSFKSKINEQMKDSFDGYKNFKMKVIDTDISSDNIAKLTVEVSYRIDGDKMTDTTTLRLFKDKGRWYLDMSSGMGSIF
ncbi:MAG: zinc-ribbon domain-containing protein [Oscillospiraceae bacterium]|nr:zinc-ribbon domain-containing protein [Oscillospiraceae bacterium]